MNMCREVVLKRGEEGNLGISIKGGKKHNLPILISRVSSQQETARLVIPFLLIVFRLVITSILIISRLVIP